MAAVRELTFAETPAAQCCVPLKGAGLTSEEAATTAMLFKALADPARVRIVNRLATQTEPACVSDFTALPGLSRPPVTFHLTNLPTPGLPARGTPLSRRPPFTAFCGCRAVPGRARFRRPRACP